MLTDICDYFKYEFSNYRLEVIVNDKLYLSIIKFTLRYRYFLYFDVKSYLADHLFIQHKVQVWYRSEFACEDSPYTAIFCREKKRDVPAFLAALDELKRNMLICGYTDYETKVSTILRDLNNEDTNYQKIRQADD